MMKKRIILLSLITILLVGLVNAKVVTRAITNYNCPEEAGASKGYALITLTQQGMANSFTVDEEVPDSWFIHSASVNPVVQSLPGPTKIWRFPGVTSNSITYRIGVPEAEVSSFGIPTSLSISGDYAFDTSGAGDLGTVQGDTHFYIRTITCKQPGVQLPTQDGGRWTGEDDHDRDHSGPGCGCPTDCDDNDQYKTHYSVLPLPTETWCNLPGEAAESSILTSQLGVDDDCRNGACCRVVEYADNQAMHYDGWLGNPDPSKEHQCNSLDDFEKTEFLLRWLNGTFDTSLDQVIIAIPNNWVNT